MLLRTRFVNFSLAMACVDAVHRESDARLQYRAARIKLGVQRKLDDLIAARADDDILRLYAEF